MKKSARLTRRFSYFCFSINDVPSSTDGDKLLIITTATHGDQGRLHNPVIHAIIHCDWSFDAPKLLNSLNKKSEQEEFPMLENEIRYFNAWMQSNRERLEEQYLNRFTTPFALIGIRGLV